MLANGGAHVQSHFRGRGCDRSCTLSSFLRLEPAPRALDGWSPDGSPSSARESHPVFMTDLFHHLEVQRGMDGPSLGKNIGKQLTPTLLAIGCFGTLRTAIAEPRHRTCWETDQTEGQVMSGVTGSVASGLHSSPPGGSPSGLGTFLLGGQRRARAKVRPLSKTGWVLPGHTWPPAFAGSAVR